MARRLPRELQRRVTHRGAESRESTRLDSSNAAADSRAAALGETLDRRQADVVHRLAGERADRVQVAERIERLAGEE